jgi:hypothetical protein
VSRRADSGFAVHPSARASPLPADLFKQIVDLLEVVVAALDVTKHPELPEQPVPPDADEANGEHELKELSELVWLGVNLH